MKTIELSAKNCKLEISSVEGNQEGLAIVKGKVSEADIVNDNGFLIELAEWQDMLSNPVNKETLEKGKMGGCVGHDARPINNDDIRFGIISHRIKNLWMEDKDVICEAVVCDTESGRNLLGWLKGGGFMQASTRLSVDETKLPDGVRGLVGANSEILTIDFVIDPAISSTFITLASKESEEIEKIIEVEESKISETTLKTVLSSNEVNIQLAICREQLEHERKINSILKGENK